jgi:hypothetical protein
MSDTTTATTGVASTAGASGGTATGAQPAKAKGADADDGPDTSQGGDQPGTRGPFSGSLRCFGAVVLTLYLIVIYGALVLTQIGLWRETKDLADQMSFVLPMLGSKPVSGNTWLLLLVLSAGALGSFVHAATSFADYIGNQSAKRSWVVWFILRPLIGSALALIFYLTLRGGLFTSGTDSKSINLYGFAAIAALAGMFSKQATDKLSEVFDVLFKPSDKKVDASRKDKLHPDEKKDGDAGNDGLKPGGGADNQ